MTTPTLKHSPRSTRGTSRSIAYTYGALARSLTAPPPRRPAGVDRPDALRRPQPRALLDERARALQPRQEVGHVPLSLGLRRAGFLILGQPLVRHAADDAP